jgi:hypothetical protein
MSDRTTTKSHSRHNPESIAPAGVPEASSARHMQADEAGVHPGVAKVAIAATIWFLLATWLSFAWNRETDFVLVVVILFFAFFIGLFLLTASFSAKDVRWPVRETNFHDFLGSDVRIGSGTMPGRDVLIQIALLPVALALAATLIGLAWLMFG